MGESLASVLSFLFSITDFGNFGDFGNLPLHLPSRTKVEL
jgi:hypothetical protein